MYQIVSPSELLGQVPAPLPAPPPPGTVVLSGFAPGGARLLPAHRPKITAIARDILSKLPTVVGCNKLVVAVEGHEDATGDPARFGIVGSQRASNVAQAIVAEIRRLVARTPVVGGRSFDMEISSAGPARPIRSDVTAGGRAMNRRVEVRVQVRPDPNCA